MKQIKLLDGETLTLNINFLTIKLVIESGIMKQLTSISDKKTEDEVIEDLDPIEKINMTGKLLWAIMYSNGKKVTEEDALMLIPLDDEDVFWSIVDEFTVKSKEFAKKAQARSNLAKLAR